MIVLALILLLLPASPAFAQGGAPSFANVRTEGLPTIYVLDQAGVETTGTLISFTDAALVLRVNGVNGMPRTFQPSQVRRVQRKGDSLKNGLIIGAVVGGFLGAVAGGGSDCPKASSGCAAFRVVIPLISAGFYTLAGAGIDALVQGRTLLWEAPQQKTGTATVSLSPGRRGVSALMRVRW